MNNDCAICQAEELKDRRDLRPDIKDGRECKHYFFAAIRAIYKRSPHGCRRWKILPCRHLKPENEFADCVGWARCGDKWEEKGILASIRRLTGDKEERRRKEVER